jgi:hypothetical protein
MGASHGTITIKVCIPSLSPIGKRFRGVRWRPSAAGRSHRDICHLEIEIAVTDPAKIVATPPWALPSGAMAL